MSSRKEKIHLQGLRNRVVNGSIWAFLLRIGSVLLVMFVNAILARILDPGALGAYFLLYSLIIILSALAMLGFNQGIVKLIAEGNNVDKQERASYYFKFALKPIILTSLLIAIVILMMGEAFLEKFTSIHINNSVILFACLLFAMHAIQFLMAETFRGMGEIKLASLFTNFLVFLLFLLSLLIFNFSDQSLNLLFVLKLFALCYLIVLLLGLVIIKNIKLKFNYKPEFKNNYVWNLVGPLWVTSLVFIIFSQMDIWIVGYFYPDKDVALYGSSVKLALVISMPLMILNSVIAPIIANLHHQSKINEMEKIVRSVAAVSLIPSTFLFFVFVLFGDSILAFVYGEFYSSAHGFLIILAFSQLFNVASGPSGLLLSLLGLQNELMKSTLIITLLIFVVSLFMGIYGFKPIAIAYCIMLGIVFQNLSWIIIAYRKLKIKTYFSFSDMYSLVITKS